MDRLLIMDFDGVIIDSEWETFQLLKQVMHTDYNYELTKEDFLVCVGASIGVLVDYLQKEYDIHFEREIFLGMIKQRIVETIDGLPLMAGVRELLEESKKRGWKTALCSSSDRQKVTAHLKRLKIHHFFDAIVTGDQVKRIKPDPEIFQCAMEELNIPPQNTLVVEDSVLGMRAALSANARVVVVPNRITGNENFAAASKRVQSLQELHLEEWESLSK